MPNCVPDLGEASVGETLDSIHLPPINKPTKKCPEDYTLSRDTGKCEPNRIRPSLREKESETDYSKEKESGLHGWFSRQGGKGKSKGWVDCNTCRKDKKTGKKTCKSCGRKKGEKRSKYPACRPTPAACGKKIKKPERKHVSLAGEKKVRREQSILPADQHHQPAEPKAKEKSGVKQNESRLV